jgi:predicted molibdopterin-dependent oxidoreductase YjgC
VKKNCGAKSDRLLAVVDHVKKALNSLEFLVVQEIFMSETAKFANVMLPGASFFEKSGAFTNGERRVQRANEVISPLAGTACQIEGR